MWIIAMFDVPTEMRTQKKKHSAFAKSLLADDFKMLLPTVFVRHCVSEKSSDGHWAHIKDLLPPGGKAKSTVLTDVQFGEMKTHMNLLSDDPFAGDVFVGGF